jgi:hypothetical protein
MPKIAKDYSKTVIYKLVNKEDYDNANIYIGSTANFTQRKCTHKSDCMNENNNAYNQKKYQFIRENGGWDEWNMIEVEKYPCNDNLEAEAREEHWRIHFNAGLNTKKCYIDISSQEYQKQYQTQYRLDNLDKSRQYRLDNRDKNIEYQRNYRLNNKN